MWEGFVLFQTPLLKSSVNVMASAGQWEVVGKAKKGKGQPPALTKSQKKTFVDRMPRIETRGLLSFYVVLIRSIKKSCKMVL